jgi:UDP-glucose 4-epimerase
MKIYITGIAGLLGSNVARHLLRNGYEVGGCDSLIGGYTDNIPITKFDLLDILDNKELARRMKGYDVVLHAAALPYEGLSVNSPYLVGNNIYSGTLSVASAAIQNNLKLMINFSSMARYGSITPPFKESDIPEPVDPYGRAKLDAERAINLLSDIHGIKIFTIVPHNVIGRGQVYTDPYRNVAAIFANRVLQDKSMFVYGDGLQKRSFSHVDDCSLAILALIESADEFPSKEVFNIGPDGNEITILDLARKVALYCDKYPNIVHLPDRPREVKYSWVSVEKAKKQLQYRPNASVDQIIKEVIGWIRGRGVQPFKYHLDLEIVKEDTPKTWTEKLI